MSLPLPSTTGKLSLLAPLTPPSLSRAWLTAPHPTRPLAATCCADKTVRIYSLTSFTLLSTIAGGHKRSVRSCAWKPGVKDAAVLATGSFDASVGVWRREDDSQRGETDFTGMRDGDYGGGVEDDEEEEEWRFALVLDGHDSEVKSVAWSAGGNMLATCSRDKSVWVWEEVGEEDFETVAVLQEHGGDVKCVVWHPEEEMLASSSYDDDVRLWREDGDDWGCVAVLKGHQGTVWAVDWEGIEILLSGVGKEVSEGRVDWCKRRRNAGPRLVSCSDDLSIRVWRRRPKERVEQAKFSILRTGNNEEDWVEEAQLPQRHERAVYSVAWSKTTGMIVSTGGDGKIVVYAERWKSAEEPKAIPPQNGHTEVETINTMDTIEPGQESAPTEPGTEIQSTEKVDGGAIDESKLASTEWVVVAEMEGAHGVFEINHVCWARRADKGKRRDGEEVIMSTGDDGAINVWTLDT